MQESKKGSLSGESIALFNKNVSKLEALEARREEIAKKALAREEEIGKLRIGYLEEFLDTYSKTLDDVIAKKTSELSDLFLILETKTAENFIAASNEISKANEAVKRNTATEKVQTGSDKSAPAGGGGNKGSGGGKGPNGTGGQGGPGNNKKDHDVVQTVSDDKRNKLKEPEDSDNGDSEGKKAADRLAAFFSQNEEERRNAILANEDFLKKIEDHRQETKVAQLKKHADQVEQIEKSLLELEMHRYQKQEDIENQITEFRLSMIQETLDAEIEAQKAFNSIDAKTSFAGTEDGAAELGEMAVRKDDAKYKLKQAQALEDAIAKERAKKELYYRRKNNGILSKEDAARIEKELANKYKKESRNEENLAKQRQRLATIQNEKDMAAERDELRQGIGELTRPGASFNERKEALYNLTHDENGNVDKGKALSAAILAVSDLAKQLEAKIDTIASYKSAIDTRMQGSKNDKALGSYWDQLVKDMTRVGAVNPFFKQEDFANNIKALVEKGISFDLKQRAFLMTVSDKIAGTFDVANGTLLRLIRIQQEDSTAGRLGMESALNAFLNEMYETSEYLEGIAESVRGSLEEMESLMSGAEATEVEWQVQKWLGSLYSVGMSQSATQSIATTLGQIGAGEIEGLTSGGTSNLLIMAANDAGLSIAEMLTGGLNSEDTNKLLQAAVNYLAELAESSEDNKVVQQQLANVFGVKASDLRAATNLTGPGSTSAIFGNSMTYDNMLSQLASMAGSMALRTSTGEMMTNFWENGQYTLAGAMAANPVSYFIYKMAKVVDDAAGGIDLPFVNVMGFGIDLNTTVSDLMRIAAVGGGILGSIGPLIAGLGNSFSGRAMLDSLGISTGSGLAVVNRGTGGGSSSGGGSGGSTSQSGYAGNSSGSDIKESTIQESEDSKKQQMIEAKEEAEENQVDMLNETVLKIYELLDDVANGSGSFKVSVEGYGLTKSASGATALGGASGVGASGGSNSSGSSSSLGNSSGFGNSSSGSSGGSAGISGSVSVGGWTTA